MYFLRYYNQKWFWISIDNNFRSKLVLFSFQNGPGFIAKKNLQMCMVVRDPKTGEVFTSGNSAMALSQLKEVEKITRRTSRDWVPEELPPQWPVPLSNLIWMPDQQYTHRNYFHISKT